MTPERWQQVEAVLQAALDTPPADRPALVARLCAGDVALKCDSIALIEAHEESDGFLKVPVTRDDARFVFADDLFSKAGEWIDSYKLLERLGEGGMAEVYLAHDRRLNRQVALKLLPATFAGDDRLRRFKQEARAASALNHPNILTIHEVGKSADLWFIASEFIDGQTVRELIAGGELSLSQVLDIALQVSSGLAAAHAAGIVHRDIKPENIMRRRDGLVKILDFGIAKLMEPPESMFPNEDLTLLQGQTEMGLILGTTSYMSPEQARGLPVDNRTDLWSLAVVLYEMFTGRLPFKGNTRIDTVVAILERKATKLLDKTAKPSALLNQLEQIIDRALAKDREERFSSAGEMMAALSEVKTLLDEIPDSEEAQRSLRHLTSASTTKLSNASVSAVAQSRSDKGRLGVLKRAQRNYAPYAGMALIVLLVISLGITVRQLLKPPPINVSAETAQGAKLYTQMTEIERLSFISEQEQRISALMGDHPEKLDEEALKAIKAIVDRYVYRKASPQTGIEPLPVVYDRAVPFVPIIAREFAQRRIPIVVGIYIPMVESEYRTCPVSPIGAKGLFQFLPETAAKYGVSSSEMCDVEKMTPAAAHYIADRMVELGEDSASMSLVLLSYNRGVGWVVETLRRLRDAQGYRRNFWTLFAHRAELDESFRKESAGYVPNFFAAAIIGENPQNFGLNGPPLTSLVKTTTAKKN